MKIVGRIKVEKLPGLTTECLLRYLLSWFRIHQGRGDPLQHPLHIERDLAGSAERELGSAGQSDCLRQLLSLLHRGAVHSKANQVRDVRVLYQRLKPGLRIRIT